ncbi:hypothetical protein [Shinella kummerowiae]|uniref:hypothetical protein n=1 Tax=Shinella kummerowiae TaxID=417745 RepID=UPI001FE8B83E|nr:hypothetical protein [Shinella kummerowiae]
MKILDLKPASGDGGGAVKLVANFDLELSPDVRLLGLRLIEAPDGRRLIYAANANGGRRTATFSPTMAQAITAVATEYLTRHGTANEQHRRTA